MDNMCDIVCTLIGVVALCYFTMLVLVVHRHAREVYEREAARRRWKVMIALDSIGYDEQNPEHSRFAHRAEMLEGIMKYLVDSKVVARVRVVACKKHIDVHKKVSEVKKFIRNTVEVIIKTLRFREYRRKLLRFIIDLPMILQIKTKMVEEEEFVWKIRIC